MNERVRRAHTLCGGPSQWGGHIQCGAHNRRGAHIRCSDRPHSVVATVSEVATRSVFCSAFQH
jgi:hypothetical protein